MALDIHRNDTKHEWLFSLEDRLFAILIDVFDLFYKETRIRIDRYADCGLDVNNQKHLIKIIDKYIKDIDFNRNKDNIIEILSFRGFLLFTIAQNWCLMFYGD